MIGTTWTRGDLAGLVAAIDRSEHVEVEYEVRDGRIVERPVTFSEIPRWDADGVQARVDFCTDVVDRGGVVLVDHEGGEAAGFAIVVPRFEPPLAWLAWLHVSRPFRRLGVASALWDQAMRLAREAGATQLYVSATPTGSAVGFYVSRGSRLADPVHAELHALEPEDIHLVCAVS